MRHQSSLPSFLVDWPSQLFIDIDNNERSGASDEPSMRPRISALRLVVIASERHAITGTNWYQLKPVKALLCFLKEAGVCIVKIQLNSTRKLLRLLKRLILLVSTVVKYHRKRFGNMAELVKKMNLVKQNPKTPAENLEN